MRISFARLNSATSFAEFFELVLLGGGQPVVALATVGPGLADPAAQGLLVDAQVLRDVGDGPAGGADLTERALAELVGVFTRYTGYSHGAGGFPSPGP